MAEINITPTQKIPRIYYMDYLRALAVLLGIVFHDTIAYTTNDYYLWFVKISHGYPIADDIILIIHIFYMPLFIFVAGFFGCQMYRTKGWQYFMRNRWSHVGIPFLIIMLIMLPIHSLRTLAWLTAQQVNVSHAMPTSELLTSSLKQQIIDNYHSSDFWRFYNNCGSYWFLYYLLIYYVAAWLIGIISVPLLKILPKKIVEYGRSVFIIIVKQPFIMSLFLFWIMTYSITWCVDISLSFTPEINIICFYALFFLFGWVMRIDDYITICIKNSTHNFLLAAGVLFPSYLLLCNHHADYGNPHYQLYKLAAIFIYSFATWYLVSSVIGLFMRFFKRPNKVVRYLADSSYWLYIAQIPIIVLLQSYFVTTSLSVVAQFSCIFILSVVLLLLSYQLFVRHTWIGQMLNGTRHDKDVADT